jgi:glycosyltransferase involved in cell wall biosynthesis
MKMCQALVVSGQDVRLVVPAGRERNEFQERSWDYLAHHYGLENEFPIEWLEASPNMRGYDYAWRATRLAQSWNADLVYTRLPQAAALHSTFHLPTVLEIHDFPQGRLGPFFLRRFLNGTGSKRLVVISNALAEDLSMAFKLPLKKSFMLIAPDGVDLSRYQDLPEPAAARRELNQIIQGHASKTGASFSIERLTIGYTGHLYPGRGIGLILDLAARLPELNFLLMGGEPDEVASLIKLVKQRKLTNLIITGFVPNADLPRYQAMCDILLMPYQRKVAASSGGDIARYLSPMKLFEYMACERAIISSDLPVLKEILSPSMARLLPPDDQEAWNQAIVSLCNDPSIRFQLASAARLAVAEYTWERRAIKFLANIE